MDKCLLFTGQFVVKHKILPGKCSKPFPKLNECTFMGTNHSIFIFAFLHKRGQLLTLCIPVDSSTDICWTSPIAILGVSGLFCRIYSIFDGKFC